MYSTLKIVFHHISKSKYVGGYERGCACFEFGVNVLAFESCVHVHKMAGPRPSEIISVHEMFRVCCKT